MDNTGWYFIAVAGAGLIALAAVPGLGAGVRSAAVLLSLCWIAGFTGIGVFKLLTTPKPWSDIVLNCKVDLRESQTKTAAGDLPPYAVYVAEEGSVIVKAGQPPQYNPFEEMFQLSDEPFERCILTNERSNSLYDVKLSFATAFIRKSANNAEVAAPHVTVVDTDSISGNGGSFDFAIINFASGKYNMSVQGMRIATSTFLTDLKNLKGNKSNFPEMWPQKQKKQPGFSPTHPSAVRRSCRCKLEARPFMRTAQKP